MIRVLIVEDDPVAAEAHAAYTDRMAGFQVVARAHTGADALRILGREPVDLVLLDMGLPDMHGLDVCRAMRAGGHRADVIAVTSARDLTVVRAAVSQGIVQYLLKPFGYPALRDKLERYAAYRDQLTGAGTVAGQHEVDRMLATLRGAEPAGLPKGMSRESLDAVVGLIRGGTAASAAEAGAALGMSRITARRYLEYLAEMGLAGRHPRYGGTGRPEVEYRWSGKTPKPG